jgi:hypothetical protein
MGKVRKHQGVRKVGFRKSEGVPKRRVKPSKPRNLSSDPKRIAGI